MPIAAAPPPARSCDGCNLCCKVPLIEALAKPAGKWCQHCDIGKGCKIHGAHPEQCRDFVCEFLTRPHLGEHWRPSACKIILTVKGGSIVALVDAGAPDAWRREPHYSELRQWSRDAAAAQRRGAPARQVLAVIGSRVVVFFPDRHVDLGILAPDERFVTEGRATPNGWRFEAVKVKMDDPRLQARRS